MTAYRNYDEKFTQRKKEYSRPLKLTIDLSIVRTAYFIGLKWVNVSLIHLLFVMKGVQTM